MDKCAETLPEWALLILAREKKQQCDATELKDIQQAQAVF